MRQEQATPSDDISRLKALILLVSDKSQDDIRFSALKLNKLLYYIDNRAYRELGQPISEATYLRLAEGPAPREMPRALRELELEGAIEHQTHSFHNGTQKRVICKQGANPEAFTREERRIIDSVVDELLYLNGNQLSEQSRQEWGWKLTKEGEVIPLAASWLAAGPLTQAQEAQGADLWNEIST
jgi:uncharacterized phage-associated protein